MSCKCRWIGTKCDYCVGMADGQQQLAAEREARQRAEADYAACAHAIGVEYAPDTGATAPGPTEAVVAAIREAVHRSGRVLDAEEALGRLLRSCAGSHAEDCHAYGADDDDVEDDGQSPDPHCDCGALAERRRAKAALAGKERVR